MRIKQTAGPKQIIFGSAASVTASPDLKYWGNNAIVRSARHAAPSASYVGTSGWVQIGG